MFTVKAVYDGAEFEPAHPINVQGRYEVIITFVQQIEDNNTQPSSINKNPRILCDYDPNKPSLLGCMEGLVKILDDFDEPLEEMKEYMY